MLRRRVPLIIAIFITSGCGLLPRSHSTLVGAGVPSAPVQTTVIQPASLRSGTKLLMVPFGPGEQVAASTELDRMALTMVKGLMETVQKDNISYHVLGSDRADQADLVVTGHIIQQERRRVFVDGWWRTRPVLAVRGKVFDRDHRVVLTFRHTVEGTSAGEDFYALAERLGQDLGGIFLSEHYTSRREAFSRDL